MRRLSACAPTFLAQAIESRPGARRRQIKPSQTKLNPSQTKPNAREMQGINLVFPCISFGESGLFSGLRASRPTGYPLDRRRHRPSKTASSRPPRGFLPPVRGCSGRLRRGRDRRVRHERQGTIDFAFQKEFVRAYAFSQKLSQQLSPLANRDCGSVLVVVIGGINVANVVQQRCHDPILVGAGPPSSCCGLKRVTKAGYL